MRIRENTRVAGGAYELLRLLGTSGTAEVYEARQVSLDRSVALKVLRAFDHEDEPRRHFLAQAQAVARLHHPNICPIFEASILEHGRPFVAMELLAGEDLETLLRRERRLSVERTIKITAQVCLALAAAHSAGMWHGNLKPRNIHIDQLHDLPDFVKVSDFVFGIGQQGLTGTLIYMSPEHLAGGERTARSDIYGVGTILYEALTGELPFPIGCGLSALLTARLHSRAPDICIQFPDVRVPPSLGRLVGQCLARSPDERPPSARWLANRLPEELAGADLKSLRSAFISYGEPDKALARRLHEALQRSGVVTFFFDEHATPGEKLYRTMKKGIAEHERVILICSRASLDRKGVLLELEETLAREHRDGEEYLIPIRLDDYVFTKWAPKNADLAQTIRDRVVADFEGADKDDEKFQTGLRKLIAALGK